MVWSVLKQVLIVAVIAYILVGALLFFTQRGMTYFPSSEPFEQCASFSSDQQVVIDEARMYVSGSSDDFLVVYHGNAGRACDRAHLQRFTQRTVVLVEYPGYGGGAGSPSEQRFKQAVDEVVSWLDEQSPSSVVVLGESIGSSSAAYHATKQEVSRLVLVSPFENLVQVAREHYGWFPVRWLVREQHPTKQYVQSFSGELVVVHGSEDSVVPARLSESLGGERFVIAGAGHNYLYAFSEARELLAEKLE